METATLPDSITSFREALGLAFELDDHSPGRTYSIHLSPDGTIETMVTTRSDASPHKVERLVFQPDGNWLLLSSSKVPIGPLRRSDILWFSFLDSMAQLRSQTLLDWIVVDGDDARSFAYLLSPQTAWMSDSVDVRRQDYNNMVVTGNTKPYSAEVSIDSR